MEIGVNICKLVFFVCLMSQVYVNNGYRSRTFRCHDTGLYIWDTDFCDSANDCGDKQDENLGCKKYPGCGSRKFACDNQCKNITVKCNTIKDCTDGTDELECGDEIHVHNCTRNDKFLCRDGLRCLGLEYTCDGNCNCFDCSDENSNCSKRDDNLLEKCPNAYFVTANGPQCLCGTKDNPLCRSIEICEGDCDQRCIKVYEKRQCTCYKGYHEVNGTNGAICRSDDWYDTLIVYATRYQIKLLNVTSNKSSTFLKEIGDCTALTAANGYVYHATLLSGNKGSIVKSSFNFEDLEQVVETNFPITSIAIDYVTNNVYFTSNGSLSVCKNDGRICTQLKCCSVDYVTLAPKSGWMFYTQTTPISSENKISLVMKSSMDGSDEFVFSEFAYPSNTTYIAVDESESKLYLMVIRNHNNETEIDEIPFDASYKNANDEAPIIPSLNVLNGHIFFTMVEKNAIYHSNTFDELIKQSRYGRRGSDFKPYFIDNIVTAVKYLYVYNSILQRSDENPCKKSSCSGLCLVKPAHSSMSTLSYTCACNNTTSTSSNPWCPTDSIPAASHSVLKVVAFVVVIGILGATLGLLGVGLRRRMRSTRSHGQRLDISDEE